MERALIVLSALALNAVLAGPRRWYMAIGLTRLAHMPAAFLGHLERRLNSEHRGARELELRGLLLASGALIAALLIGWLCEILFTANWRFIELLIVTLALPVRPAWDIAAQIRAGLRAGKPEQAKAALADTAWRHHALLDEHGVARAGIETLAVQFFEKILAPVFWYLVLGLPGLFASKMAWLLCESLALPGAQPFGKTARAVQETLHYLPSRLAAILWLMAGVFLPSAPLSTAGKRLLTPLVTMATPSLPMLAAASLLRVALGGPTSIYSREAWVGEGMPKAGAADVGRALFLFALANLLLFLLLGLLL